MGAIFTALEVLAIAIRSQADAARRFGRLSRMMTTPERRSAFRRMAREEARHKQVLVHLYSKMTPDGRKPSCLGDNNCSSDQAGSLEHLLRESLDQAAEAREFYQLAARTAPDLSTRLVFESLFQAAAQQSALLTREIEITP